MSDIIICINVDESRRKKRFIVDTYEGSIPNLKSQKYSGQLRNTDVFKALSYSNVDVEALTNIRRILCMHPNIQINKYQFIVATTNIKMFLSLIDSLMCLIADVVMTVLNLTE